MEERKRLLIVQEAMGGCGRNVVDIVNGIDHSKFDVTVAYGTSRMDDYYRNAIPEMDQHATLIPVPELVRDLSMSNDVKAWLRIRGLIKKIKPDILHCHSSKAGIIGRSAAFGRHVPKVFYTPHAYAFQAWEFSESKKRFFAFLERMCSHFLTTCTFSVSKGERDIALQNRIDKPDKFKVVYNGIPDITLPSRDEALEMLGLSDLPHGAVVIGSTVRLAKQKDPMTFVRIAKTVVEHNPLAHFVCVGDGNLQDDVSRFVADHGLGSNVHLLGYRDDAERIVTAFDVYLLTSLYEGLPYSLVEALRAGVPIVATNVTGSNEVVRPGVNGYLFNVGDVEDGVRQVKRVISERSHDGKFSYDIIRSTYLDKFTSQRMLDSVQESYLG
ncbi:glycosyltransferase [Bifidobacterium catenulatum subsp. catenulatum]|uniref:glycosyltransferase n=1 Tax=Bifidobacterium catenulatum TaxID=1686 RepID=UPI003D33494D